MVLRRSRVAFLRFLVGGQRVIKNSKGGGGAEELQPPLNRDLLKVQLSTSKIACNALCFKEVACCWHSLEFH